MRVALTTVISILSFIHLVFRQASADSDGGICSTNPCGKWARCVVKLDGTFVCRCKKGFTGIYPKCVDINECLLTPPKCGANKRCLNTKGSFRCPCLPGYVRNSTGACNDVDECASFPCGTDALCTNLPGTYSCTCGNPEEACIGIDECEQSPCGIPSTEPSNSPSSVPSKIPSSVPSKYPSIEPSNHPSTQPSEYPTESILPTILQNNNEPIYNIVVPKNSNLFTKGLQIPFNAPEAGMWSSLVQWPIVSIHSTVMPDGKVLTYGRASNKTLTYGRTFVFWDPLQGRCNQQFELIPNPQTVESFCSSAIFLSDGTFLLSGGAGYMTGATSLETSILNWQSQTTVRAPDLMFPRWYGTLTKLPDGRALFTGGGTPYIAITEGYSRSSIIPEIYNEGQGWSSLVGAKSDDAFAIKNQKYYYPRQWVTPSGTVFGITSNTMWELNVTGSGSIKNKGDFKTKVDVTSRPNIGPTNTALMFERGKILQVGGIAIGRTNVSSNLATVIDINNIQLGVILVNETSPMTFARHWHNSIVLPNGHVLITGGASQGNNDQAYAVLPSEIWNPMTGTWTTGASAAVYRGYHSSAVLLPNGAVLSAGGGLPGPVTNYNSEIYFPPYFFQRVNGVSVLAEFPKIISFSNNTFSYGSPLLMQIANNELIAQVGLISLPVVTHSFDTNQRRLTLKFRPITNGLLVRMPNDPNLAPPGYYYLSVISNTGVPSEAIIIGLNTTAPPLPRSDPIPNPSQAECI